ncbi:hypothetical protein PISMIDRAFT_571827 [Pisolithus microcarpus 441]|uniref:Uncharacterized protein n=1 Tax=Pisolithus microcarpus 441 TaxID=765257 RepID=A0A0C9ZM38_9AGAM|nr:hypothetical protein PISMIDRAFT_571827 [Pisolithus microcarpus 441]
MYIQQTTQLRITRASLKSFQSCRISSLVSRSSRTRTWRWAHRVRHEEGPTVSIMIVYG